MTPGRLHHDAGCPRLQFWDAGDHEAECTCEYDDSNDDDDMTEALFKSEAGRDHAISRVRFLRRMIESALAQNENATNARREILEQALKSDAEDADNHV